MADGSALDPYHVIVDSGSLESTVTPSAGSTWSVLVPEPLGVDVLSSPSLETSGTASVAVQGFTGDWGSSLQAYMTATICLLVVLVFLAVVQVVQGVRRG